MFAFLRDVKVKVGQNEVTYRGVHANLKILDVFFWTGLLGLIEVEFFSS